MFEEDQHLVLAMFNSLFDDAADENALIEFFGSPTKQAVTLARAYNARSRKLQVRTTSRSEVGYEEDEEEIPAFIIVLEDLRDEAETRGLVNYQQEPVHSVWDTEENKPEVSEETKPVELPRSEPSTETQPEPEKAEEMPEVPEAEKPAEDVKPEAVVEPLSDLTDESASAVQEVPVPAEYEPEAVIGVIPDTSAKTERRVSTPLAVLYGIFAVPLALAISTVLLVPTFISLGLSGACIFAGVKTLLAAFSGFSMFSDIMVVLGCGLVIVALGLLFLWMFIWFVGGAIAGVINGFISLGSRWCSKEVPVK